MQAIAYTAYGGPNVTKLLSLPVPTAKAGEVLVKVAGGGLNPVDALQRSGKFKQIYAYQFPQIAGNEFSGVVTAVGDGVTSFAVGDKIIARSDKSRLDAFAEYAAIDSSLIARAPANVPLVDAAGLPLAGLTAYQALNRLDVKKGDHVLITAGAGGVGLLAIQLAKLRGATVATTASPAGESYVKKAGADEVINYRETKLSSLGPTFDKVFDLAAHTDEEMQETFAAVKKGGRVLTVSGPPTPNIFEAAGLPWWKNWIVSTAVGWTSRATINAAKAKEIDYEFFFMRPDGKELQLLSDLVAEGKLDVVIDSRFKLAEYEKAYEKLESGRSKGKVIIDFE
ncbi:hypothetical protein VHUM_04198 [Vanrija humicola]|uniref:Enoyl reductase (ER) domain-containing protein n=1 Tax=Vanrija humicola TaxID=5417 RepID=A0A7D8Z2A7_VANHU|nr:hypothetical protein VHUM_04198 [Vanrija humicola]